MNYVHTNTQTRRDWTPPLPRNRFSHVNMKEKRLFLLVQNKQSQIRFVHPESDRASNSLEADTPSPGLTASKGKQRSCTRKEKLVCTCVPPVTAKAALRTDPGRERASMLQSCLGGPWEPGEGSAPCVHASAAALALRGSSVPATTHSSDFVNPPFAPGFLRLPGS